MPPVNHHFHYLDQLLAHRKFDISHRVPRTWLANIVELSTWRIQPIVHPKTAIVIALVMSSKFIVTNAGGAK